MTTASDIDHTLAEACAAVGLAAHNAAPIRLGENAIFRLPGDVIARVSRQGQQSSAAREIAVSRWLNASGVAAVAALAGIEQPVEVGERSVTFWEELPAHQQGSLVQVAGVLKRLHALPVPTKLPLGQLDPFVRLAKRIESATTVPEVDRVWLRARLAALQAQWRALAPELPTTNTSVMPTAWTSRCGPDSPC